MFWSNTENKREKTAEIGLEDVVPESPNEYPARNLKARLAARRIELWEMRSRRLLGGVASW